MLKQLQKDLSDMAAMRRASLAYRRERILKLWAHGLSIGEIARSVAVSRCVVDCALRRAGIVRRGGHRTESPVPPGTGRARRVKARQGTAN